MNGKRRILLPKNVWRTILWVLLAALLVWGIQWVTYARPPLPLAVEALASDERVTVAQEPWLTFYPTDAAPTTGFIFYPGGRIDPQGYAPLMREIAHAGYLIIVPRMPLNMAPFNANIADEIQAHFPQVRYWVIGGHSVGGTMAAQYTFRHPEGIDGLVIWASYPADNTNLADFSIPIALIYGSLDPRVNAASVAERQALLPADCRYVQIDGGDHHQFGAYRITPEEHHAEISMSSQHEEIIQATLALLAEVQN